MTECNISSEPSPQCQHSYRLSILLFAAVVLPLNFRSISKQASLQTFFAVYRALTLLAMLATILACSLQGPFLDTARKKHIHIFDNDDHANNNILTLLWKPAGFGYIIMIVRLRV